jgi:hypothetical protein
LPIYAGTQFETLGWMRMAGLLALVGAVACGGHRDDGTYLHLRIDSAAAFDRLRIYTLEGAGLETFGPPVTPRMLMNAEPLPTAFEIAGSSNIYEVVTIDPPRMTFASDDWGLITFYSLVVVAGFRDGVVVGGSAAVPQYRNEDGASHATVELALGPIEMWGTGDVADCARVADPSYAYYAVRARDVDCDGQLNADDCQPAVYCLAELPSTCACP